MFCFQSFLDLGMPRMCIQLHIVGKLFFFNVYRRFLLLSRFFYVFSVLYSFQNVSTSMASDIPIQSWSQVLGLRLGRAVYLYRVNRQVLLLLTSGNQEGCLEGVNVLHPWRPVQPSCAIRRHNGGKASNGALSRLIRESGMKRFRFRESITSQSTRLARAWSQQRPPSGLHRLTPSSAPSPHSSRNRRCLRLFFQSDEKYTVPVIIYTDVLTINSGLISSNIFVPKV